jgi:hypothetical protein
MGPKGQPTARSIDYNGAVRAGRRPLLFEDCASPGRRLRHRFEGLQGEPLVRCEVTDTGAGGIRIGETTLRRTRRQDRNEVTDCHIHDIGSFSAGVAIWVGHSAKNRSAQPHPRHVLFGVFDHLSWGYGPSGAQENISRTRARHRRSMADGGKCNSGHQQVPIRNNVFHDIWSSTYGG